MGREKTHTSPTLEKLDEIEDLLNDAWSLTGELATTLPSDDWFQHDIDIRLGASWVAAHETVQEARQRYGWDSDSE